MYTYFCIGVALVGVLGHPCACGSAGPSISNVSAGGGVRRRFVFDFVIENLIIRIAHAYAFAQTPAALTLWAGSQYQFPIYESVCVGALGVCLHLPAPERARLPGRAVVRPSAATIACPSAAAGRPAGSRSSARRSRR